MNEIVLKINSICQKYVYKCKKTPYNEREQTVS